ncbi:MBL fold metallo-hydrolase [Devosia lucknowensis]|nr:MBL fold metallo-hydrolase [Devosia lucknowensis]
MGKAGSVNGWIIGSGATLIVDGGVPGAEASARWDQAEQADVVGAVEAILCTHMHRDHSGQIPRLVARHGVPLLMTEAEHRKVVAASEASTEQRQTDLTSFLIRQGVAPAEARSTAPPDYSVLASFPRDYQPLDDGMTVTIAGRAWRVLTGGGHSSKGACLISEDGQLMVAGDQILGGTGPHITVGLDEPEADLLSAYFDFLGRLADLPDTMLVLPGHGSAFRSLPAHALALRKGHQRRLDRLKARLDGAMSCTEMAPLVFTQQAMRHFGYLVPGMALSLANHLWHRGELQRHEDDDGVWRFASA